MKKAHKYHPILFSGPMVEALLEGRKTQTRRAVKLLDWSVLGPGLIPGTVRMKREWEEMDFPCPYGKPGHLLWVRETFAYYGPKAPVYKAAADPRMPWQRVKWRPFIHMPRWASRLTLRITDVRVEWLQDISEEDAQAEGAEPWYAVEHNPDGTLPVDELQAYRTGFADLWNSLNEKRGLGWNVNPWVWVLTFTVINK